MKTDVLVAGAGLVSPSFVRRGTTLISISFYRRQAHELPWKTSITSQALHFFDPAKAGLVSGISTLMGAWSDRCGFSASLDSFIVRAKLGAKR